MRLGWVCRCHRQSVDAVGPGDIKPTADGDSSWLDAACGRMPAYVDTGLNIVHVDDVAAGHLLAFETRPSGRALYSGWRGYDVATILGQIARLVGRAPAARPSAVCRGVARCLPCRSHAQISGAAAA